MTPPRDDLDLLRDIRDGVAPPDAAVRERARAQLVAAARRRSPSRGRWSTGPATDPNNAAPLPSVEVVTPPAARPRRRLVAGLVAAGLLVGAAGLAQGVLERGVGPPPAISSGERPIPVPDGPLPLRVDRDLDYTSDPALFAAGLRTTVYAPDAPGPWPLVVLVADEGDGDGDLLGRAAASLAERGLVVHVVTTRDHDRQLTLESIEQEADAVGCALAHARATAGTYDALPERTVLVGQGLSAWASAVFVLRDPRTPDEGPCAVPRPREVPAAFVGVAGDYGCWGFDDCPTTRPDLRPYRLAGENTQVPILLLAPSHSAQGSPEPEREFASALEDAGHRVELEVFERSSPSDLHSPGSPAARAVADHIVRLARG